MPVSNRIKQSRRGQLGEWTSTPMSIPNKMPASKLHVDEDAFDDQMPSSVSEIQPKIGELEKKPTFLFMICDAIKVTGDKRKGASVQTIKKWLIGHYGYPDDKRLNSNIRKNLLKGTENGVLGRPKNSQVTGARGFFVIKDTVEVKQSESTTKTKKTANAILKKKLGQPKPAPRVKPSVPVSDSEVTFIKPDQKRLRRLTNMNFSDSELPVASENTKAENKGPTKNKKVDKKRLSVKTAKIRKIISPVPSKRKNKRAVENVTKSKEIKSKAKTATSKVAKNSLTEEPSEKQSRKRAPKKEMSA